MILSPDYFEGGDMSVVSPQTLNAREAASAVLVRHAVGKLTMAEAEHELWKIINGLTDDYDLGYNTGYRAAEEERMRSEHREPPFKEVR